jgi:hypothetical protein
MFAEEPGGDRVVTKGWSKKAPGGSQQALSGHEKRGESSRQVERSDSQSVFCSIERYSMSYPLLHEY